MSSTPNDVVLDVVFAAAGKVLDWPTDAMSASTPLVDMRADSVALIVIADVLNESGYDISDAALKAARTLGDLAAAVTPLT